MKNIREFPLDSCWHCPDNVRHSYRIPWHAQCHGIPAVLRYQDVLSVHMNGVCSVAAPYPMVWISTPLWIHSR